MKHVLATLAAVLCLSAVYTPSALALPVNSTQRTYFDDQGHIIGESIRYCNNNTQHWGVASSTSQNYAEVFYGCSSNDTSVHFGSQLPTAVRDSFCVTYGTCSRSEPSFLSGYQTGPVTSGMYSN
ncbi:hypothetical protein FHW69_002650 [Luteibacter sp. Sphag1AF]|uniref:DUF6289 family protein n=1 Tax=Luteibacter sp. Sphag1AF TaxID=2587031 RepID=UPI0016220696|nr:DUF6289 family protein [Luteibacter sp. Sphag1AF]MBB3228018.1 hypothetical protein [Luteibacter sp. Sphag1AF]